MGFDWKIFELAAWANLILGGGWKISRIIKDWVTNIVDARLALQVEKMSTKEEVQEIHRELQNLIEKHIH